MVRVIDLDYYGYWTSSLIVHLVVRVVDLDYYGYSTSSLIVHLVVWVVDLELLRVLDILSNSPPSGTGG